MNRSSRTVAIHKDDRVFSLTSGGSYGCSEERSIYCLGGPFSELVTSDPADYATDGMGVCPPCAVSLGWPVSELRNKMKARTP